MPGEETLPPHATPLIGRAREIKSASHLLRQPYARLLTLTGLGGVEKTRLSLRIAAEVAGDFAVVCFVSLADISDPNLVVAVATQVLELREAGSHDPFEQLTAYLRDRHVLLVLDNFAHVLPAASVVRMLLSPVPGSNSS